MFEKRAEPLLPLNQFIIRLIRSFLLGTLLVIAALFMGMIGYHTLEHMSWIDSFVNAAMILSGMGPLTTLNTNPGKIFAGCYALFSGLAFIVFIGVFFAPIIHRFLHQFHINTDDESKHKKPLA